MSEHELTKMLRELKGLKGMAEELAAEITGLEDEIKATMTAQGVDELKADIFRVTWKPVTSNRFDTASFKAKYGDLYQSFTKQTTTRRFTVA